MSQFTQVVNQPYLSVNGLSLTVPGSNKLITVSAGIARDSTNQIDINLGNYLGLASELSANTNTTINGAINGANGLDTGSLANDTWYYIYLINDPSGYNQSACILSTSGSGPLMPAGLYADTGYSVYRRIAMVLTDGSANFLKVYVFGNGNERVYRWDVVITELSAQGGTSYAALSLASSVPPTAQMVYLQWLLDANTAGNSFNLRPTGSTSVSNIGANNPVATPAMLNQIEAITNSSQSIDWKTEEASDDLTLWTIGFTDFI